MKINFMSSKDCGESLKSMHSKKDYIETRIGNNTNKIINESFSFFPTRYQIG